jgi:hypothetical protein
MTREMHLVRELNLGWRPAEQTGGPAEFGPAPPPTVYPVPPMEGARIAHRGPIVIQSSGAPPRFDVAPAQPLTASMMLDLDVRCVAAH